MKLVLRLESSVDSVPPTICFTDPACKSIHGRKRVILLWRQCDCHHPNEKSQSARKGEPFPIGFQILELRVLRTPQNSENWRDILRLIFHTEMAATLGKRKRQPDVIDDSTQSHGASDEETLRSRFQRAFEAKFKPLQGHTRPRVSATPEEIDPASSEEDSDWSGILDGDDNVETVKHDGIHNFCGPDSNSETKAFMVGTYHRFVPIFAR